MQAERTALILTLLISVCMAQEPKANFETPAMPENPPKTWLTYHLAHPGRMLPGLKLVPKPRVQLYNLDADPKESQNLAASNPELVKEMTATLKGYKESSRSTTR